jgi:hypothetical protein
MKSNADDSGAQPQKLALSRTEAAIALDVSPATIDRLTKRGLLNPSRATRRPLYALAELHRFLAESTAALTGPHPFSDASSIGGTSQRKEV